VPDAILEATNLKPPLKWAGGKRWLVPHLRPLWEPFANRRLVEPFCGGLAVALGLMPDRALLNDRNPHLINFLWS
jgi:DNA adenine methylase